MKLPGAGPKKILSYLQTTASKIMPIMPHMSRPPTPIAKDIRETYGADVIIERRRSRVSDERVREIYNWSEKEVTNINLTTRTKDSVREIRRISGEMYTNAIGSKKACVRSCFGTRQKKKTQQEMEDLDSSLQIHVVSPVLTKS